MTKKKVTSKKNRSSKGSHILYGYAIAFLILVAIALANKDKLSYILSDPQLVKDFIASFGVFGPVVLITAQILQVIIFIIPGPVFTMAGGYAFGLFWGSVYSYIGTVLGAILVFYLAKKFGRPFVERMVSKRDIQHFDVMYEKRGRLALLITRSMPILFPNDAISFAAGLTSLNYKQYIGISMLGFIPHILLLTFFGEQLTTGSPWLMVIIALVGFGVLAYLFRHPIKIFILDEVRAFENELKTVEHKSTTLFKKELKIVEDEFRLFNIFREYRIIRNFPQGFPWYKRWATHITILFTSLTIHPRNNVLLTRKDMLTLSKSLQKGDIVLVGSLRLLFALLIRQPVTHALIYVGNNKFINETVEAGARYRTLKDAFGRYDTMIVLRLPKKTKKRSMIIKKAISWTEQKLGKPYDFEMDETKEEFTCAELINDAYKAAGFDSGVSSFRKGTEKQNAIVKGMYSIRPSDFVGSNFEVVAHSENIRIDNNKIFLIK